MQLQQAIKIKSNLSNIDSCCKNERGFCEWVSYEQKPLFFFKISSPSACGLHFTSVTQNRKNRAEFSIIFAFHCQLDAAINYCHNMIVHENDLCLMNLIEMEGEETQKLSADHRYP